jgi:general transcription factor 3C polypeptide 5 (transcription factor C subunit 1)
MVHVAYMWRAGPWRDTCVLYGVGPQYRKFQNVVFQVETERSSSSRKKGEAHVGGTTQSHGKNLVKDAIAGAFDYVMSRIRCRWGSSIQTGSGRSAMYELPPPTPMAN